MGYRAGLIVAVFFDHGRAVPVTTETKEITMLRNTSSNLLLASAAFMLAMPAHAITYTLTSASTISITGEIDASFAGTFSGVPFTSTGSGILAEQAPGSLATTLSGTIDADVIGANLSFVSDLVAANSGSWQPTNSPANFGLTSSIFMDSSTFIPDFTMSVVGAVSGITTNISGSALLDGSAGNQSFSALLGGYITSGVVDAVATPTPLYIPSITLLVPLTNIALTGVADGTLVSDGITETLTVPFSAIAEFTVVVPVNANGVVGTTTLSMTRHAIGEIVAVRPIPEPETWAMLLAGLGLVGMRLQRRRD
jgi:hypothetical protein